MIKKDDFVIVKICDVFLEIGVLIFLFLDLCILFWVYG